jgi:hypothetical protein
MAYYQRQMQPFFDLMEEAHGRQAERMAGADRARMRAEARRTPPRAALTLRTATLLRQVADHLEGRSIRTA